MPERYMPYNMPLANAITMFMLFTVILSTFFGMGVMAITADFHIGYRHILPEMWGVIIGFPILIILIALRIREILTEYKRRLFS